MDEAWVFGTEEDDLPINHAVVSIVSDAFRIFSVAGIDCVSLGPCIGCSHVLAPPCKLIDS